MWHAFPRTKLFLPLKCFREILGPNHQYLPKVITILIIVIDMIIILYMGIWHMLIVMNSLTNLEFIYPDKCLQSNLETTESMGCLTFNF